MHRRFKLLYFYDETEDTVHIVDIWDTRMKPETLIMKKLLLSFTLMLLPLMASAYDALINGVFYDFDTSTKTAAVTSEGKVIWDDGIYLEGNNTSSGDVIIPSALSYNAHKVSDTL